MIYLETIRDASPMLNIETQEELRSRVTVHEIGHQFFVLSDLPHPGEHHDDIENIMQKGPVAPDDKYYFADQEIRTMRWRLASPGT